MPKDLPGLYWDAERNRYFPISSRPSTGSQLGSSRPAPAKQLSGNSRRKAGGSRCPDVGETRMDSPSQPPAKYNVSHTKRKVSCFTLAQNSLLLPPFDWAGRGRNMRAIRMAHIGATSRLSYNHAPTFGKITTFCTFSNAQDSSASDDHARWHILGDARGWLFRCKTSYRDHDIEEPSRLDSDLDVELNWLPWSAELNLQPNGSVSSVSMWGSRWVATGAGTSARFASSDIQSLDRMFIVTLPGARDLWASDLRERSIAFGASFRAIYIPDIDHSTTPEQLNTHSDVFTISQDQNLIYTGARNGAIHRFDKRVGLKSRGDLLLDSRFTGSDQRSSVLNLTLLGAMADNPNHPSATSSHRIFETGLFVSQMNGELQTFDLRFITSKGGFGARGTSPVLIYGGHVNNHTRELGLAIDSTNDMIYAAGQDCRVRGWSLSTGEPIILPHSANSASVPISSVLFNSHSSSSFAHNQTPQPNSASRRQPPLATPTSPWTYLNPFSTTFKEPVTVLRVSSGDDGHNVPASACLWGASGEDLWRWNLGQRSRGVCIV